MDSDASSDHMADEKPVEKSVKTIKNFDKNVLHCFTKLASHSEKDRMNAAVSILRHLGEKQQESQDDAICSELLYSVKRLVRGMWTTRMDSRFGFYATFVTLLSTFHQQISVSKIVEILTQELDAEGKQTKSEKAEACTAQVLTYGALIQAGRVTTATVIEQQLVVTNLLNVAANRSYLPIVAYSFLVNLLEQVTEKRFKKVLWPSMKTYLSKPWSEQTLDTFYFLLVASSRFPSVVNAAFFSDCLDTQKLVHQDSLTQCCQLFMRIDHRSSLLHPALEVFCRHLAICGLVGDFWSDVLETRMSETKRTKLTDLVVAQLFRLTVGLVEDKTQLLLMFTPHLMDLLVKSSQKKRAERDECSLLLEESLDQVGKVMKGADDDVAVALIKKLIFHPGTIDVEQSACFKVVRQLTAQLQEAGVHKLAKTYAKIIDAKKSSGADNTKMRVTVAQLYARLIGHTAVLTDVDWKAKRLRTLLHHGLFRTDLSTPAAVQVRDAFYRALDQKARLDHVRILLTSVVTIMRQEMAKETPLRQPLGAKAQSAWNAMIAVTDKLGRVSNKTLSTVPLFHTMFLHLGLQLFKDTKMAAEALQELHSCHERVTASKKTKKVALREGDLEAGDPEWAEVAVELMLSLLAHDSHLLRSVVMAVFPHLLPHLTPSALQQILNVFDTRSDTNPLSVESDDISDEDSASDDDEDGEDEDENEEEEEEEDSWDEDEGEKETVNDKLRMAVSQALGTASAQTDTESVDLDDMDEEEGKRLTTALSSAFRLLRESRPKKTTKQAKEEEALMHFRSRVLGLVEVVLGAEPTMGTCLELVAPLFVLLQFCMHDTHQKPLENRTRGCLRKLSNVKSWSSCDDVTQQQVVAVLASLLDKGDRPAPVYLDMIAETAMVCTFLVRCSVRLRQAATASAPDEVEALYKQALADFMLKRDCLLNLTIFKSVLQLVWAGNWTLASDLTFHAFSGKVRMYKRQQAVLLLHAFIVNARMLSEEEQAAATLRKLLLKSATQLFLDHASSTLKTTYLVELAGLLRALKKSDNQSQGSKLWLKLSSALESFANTSQLNSVVLVAMRPLFFQLDIKLNKNSRSMATQVISDSSSNATTKDLHESENDDNEEVINEKVKTKKNKSNPKLKKQSKDRRLAAMSEGFQHTKFSFEPEVNLDGLNGGSEKPVNGKKSGKRKLNGEGNQNVRKKKK